MRLFLDCLKDATAQAVHATTAMGNEKQRRFREAVASEDQWEAAKNPAAPLKDDEDADIIRSEDSKKSWQLPFTIKKADPDQRLIFGWASVVEKNGEAVIDKQQDIIPVYELERAAYDFVLYSREQGDMHQRVGVGKMVESMVFTKEKQEALGVDLGMVGWWVGFKVEDDGLWAAHKRGERPEFSIGGHAVPFERV